MSEVQEKIQFLRDGVEVEFYILEQVTIGESHYILVADTLDGDADAYILKEISVVDDEVTYEEIDDESEIEETMNAFSKLLDNVDFKLG